MSRTTKIANIPRVPNNIDRGLANFLNSVKESIEVARGRAGDPDSYVTKKDLEELGYSTATPVVTPAKSPTSSTQASSTPARAFIGLHSVGTANIMDRAVTAIKIAEGVIPGAAYILELIRDATGTVNVTTVNAATYDLLVTDYILHVTYTATGAVTSLTLPTAQCAVGRVIHIKDAGGLSGTNNITIDTEGAETIDGDATLIICGDYDSASLYSDGSNWFVF